MAKKKRSCGTRQPGGVYAETGMSPHGSPVEDFIVDPHLPFDVAKAGLTARGVQLVEIDGVYHVFDIVGKKYYPNVADYVEEVRRMGASRRLASNLDFSKLGPGSKLVLLHEKAIIENHGEYPVPHCPKGLEHPEGEMCAGHWWQDFAEKDLDEAIPGLGRARSFLHFAYRAAARPKDVEPVYRHGIFMMLPISNLAVIKGRNETEEQKANKNYQAALNSGIPVYLEEE